MSDTARGSDAWRITPDEYLEQRSKKICDRRERKSVYVAVRDRTRLAVDVYTPDAAQPAGGWPTIIIFTPYYRRFKIKGEMPAGGTDAPNSGQFRDFFVPRGYAVVIVDVRGTGASCGSRRAFRAPVERDDYFDVIEWCVDQPWCVGALGSLGISFVGAAADFAASTGHPALKAVFPMFSVWDTYANMFFPGGVFMSELARGYGDLAQAMDLDQRDEVRQYAYFSASCLDGPAAVDEDDDGHLLRAAIAEHYANFDFPSLLAQLQTRDAAPVHDPELQMARLSPYHYVQEMRADLATYSVSGWFDGAGYSDGAATRYRSLRQPRKRLILGPWDHGARTNVSAFRSEQQPQFQMLAEALRFFDHHIKNVDTGLEDEQPVHYFTMAEEKWKSAADWPPAGFTPKTFYLDARFALTEQPCSGSTIPVNADLKFHTGKNSRHERLFFIPVAEYYSDWNSLRTPLLSFTSSVLPTDCEMTGHAFASIVISSSASDASLFVYIEDVAPDGACLYVTEGCLRASHRKYTAEAPGNYRCVGPHHTHLSSDVSLLQRDEPTRLDFTLLPVSWLFRVGHAIRVSLSLGDRAHYAPIPAGTIPHVKAYLGGEFASRVVLPLRTPRA